MGDSTRLITVSIVVRPTLLLYTQTNINVSTNVNIDKNIAARRNVTVTAIVVEKEQDISIT